jgi:hypothetical protein
MHFNEGERHYLVWLRLRRAVFFVSFVLTVFCMPD